MHLLPAALRACTWGQTTALPMPPPTQTTVLPVGISVALPRGPARSWISSPTSRSASISVVLPTTWKTRVMVPLAGLRLAMVKGMRSPSSLTRRMMNCPALPRLAMWSASISKSFVCGASSLANTILFPTAGSLQA